MDEARQLFERVDKPITTWMARYGLLFLRLSLGVVFFWFGFLKFFPDLSPAQDLAARTIEQLTFGLIGPELSIYLLAVWESLIGLGLISAGRVGISLGTSDTYFGYMTEPRISRDGAEGHVFGAPTGEEM